MEQVLPLFFRGGLLAGKTTTGMSDIKLLFARYVVPVVPEGKVYNDHCVVVQNDKILEIIPSTLASQKYASVPESDRWVGRDHVLLPGFVNCHTHAAMSLMRGIADDISLMPWLQEHIWPAEAKFVSPEFVTDGTNIAIAEMLRGGTTCFNDMYFYPDQIGRAAHTAGIRAVVGLIAIGFPSAYCGHPEKSKVENIKMYIDRGIQIKEEVFDNMPLVHAIIAPHAPYTCDIDGLRYCQEMADTHKLGLHIHLHETKGELNDWTSLQSEHPIASLDKLGMLKESLVAVHMTQLTDEEIDRIAETKVSVAHCPESNMKLASGSCPVARLLARGVNVAIGTDGCASNNDLDMLAEMRMAALHGKLIAGDPEAVPAAKALAMATINGARALGLGDVCGSLEPGKAADIQAINLGDIESQPIYNVVSHLVYCTSRHQVTDVWVAGEPVLKDRKLLTLDESAVLAKAKEWGGKIGQADRAHYH